MSDPDQFLRLADGPETESRVKGSRFVGQVLAASSAEAVQDRLETIRKRYHDATHHCWAAVWGAPAPTGERFDDDGEPSGSAGRPILRQLQACGASDGVVVVTRWFGGTKLGTGGLIQAYGAAARDALAAAPRCRVERRTPLQLSCTYEDLGGVEAVLARRQAWVRDVHRDFGDAPGFRIEVPCACASALERELVAELAGRVRVRAGDEILAAGRPRLVDRRDDK